MEKKRKTKFKKIVAILCVFVVLQSYFSAFAQVSVALSDLMGGGDSMVSGEDTVGKKDENTGAGGGNGAGNGEQSGNGAGATGNGEQSGNGAGATGNGEQSGSGAGAAGSTEQSGDQTGAAGGTEQSGEQAGATGNGEQSGDQAGAAGNGGQSGSGSGAAGNGEQSENQTGTAGSTEQSGDQTGTAESSEQDDGDQTGDIEEEPYVEPEATVEVTSENSNIYKGYLYANATSDLGYETYYNTIDTINIVGGKNLNSLTVQDEPDKIEFITNTKLSLRDTTYYRQTRISVEEFVNILGEDGQITLYDIEGNVIGYINKETPVQNGEYVFVYPAQYDTVRLELTNIKKDGKISIKNDKAIKDNSNFNRNQISLFAAINTMTEVNLYEEGKEVKTYKGEANINLDETESKMLIDTDTTMLSVEDKNDISINVTLKTDQEKYDLFANPTIDIEFPSAVENLEVKNISLLYKNGLSINTCDVVENELGRKVVKLSLTGNQSEYTPGAANEGTTLVLHATAEVNRLTANSSGTIKMTYTNKDTVRQAYALEGKDSEEAIVNFVGRQELLRALEAKASPENMGTSYNGDSTTIQIEPNKNQVVTVKGTIVNNYETTLTDVVILGRIPFVGNKSGIGNDLQTNFDASLKNAITSTGSAVEIFYSEDGEAEVGSAGWTKDTSDMSKYKSFKIVITDKKLEKSGTVSFSYDLDIPESVGYNAKGYTTYTVYYKMDLQEYASHCLVGIQTETKELGINDIQADDLQALPKLTIGTQVSQGGTLLKEGDKVFERQILNYTVIVENTSGKVINNATLHCKGINGNIFGYDYITVTQDTYPYAGEEGLTVKELKEFTKEEKPYEEFIIENLQPEESRTYEFQVIVDKDAEETYGEIEVSGDEIDTQTVETTKFQVEDALLEVRVSYAGTEALDEEDGGVSETLPLSLNIKNISGRTLNNVKGVFILPEELNFIEDEFIYFDSPEEISLESFEKVKENSVVTFNINSLSGDEESNAVEICIYPEKKELDSNITSKKISVMARAEVEGNVYNSNIYTKEIFPLSTIVDYSWTSDLEKEILENGDEVTFKLKVTNNSPVYGGVCEIRFNLDDGLVVKNVKIYEDDELKTDRDELHECEEAHLYEEGNFEIQVNCVVDRTLFVRNQDKIEVKASVSEGMFDDFDTEVISYKINNDNVAKYKEEQKDPEVDQEDPTKPIIPDNPEYPTDPIDPENPTIPDQPNDDDNNNNGNGNNGGNNNNNGNGNNNNNGNNNGGNNNNNNNNNNSNNGDDTQQPSVTYGISGFAWVDKNQDGIRQSTEELLRGVIVNLYRANSNGGIDTSKVIATTSTGEDGEYNFSRIENGNYIIVFDYNSNRYKVTQYQVKTAKSTENSDAISKTLTINGATSVLGVTDVLTIDNGNLTSIDIGVVDKTNFDFKLEKTISSITVKNDSGTKSYKYRDSKNTKLEIRSKYYKSSVVDITYKFKVTNEGDVAGNVNKVVDYLPNNVQVNLNKSEGWYIGPDNGLYYTGLLNKEIAPGETKEFTLVLRKDLSDGESVNLTNGAEILELTNSQGLLDRDSVENNQVKAEDDYSESILTITIATGRTASYIGTLLILIVMTGAIGMVIIKLKNTKKIYR